MLPASTAEALLRTPNSGAALVMIRAILDGLVSGPWMCYLCEFCKTAVVQICWEGTLAGFPFAHFDGA